VETGGFFFAAREGLAIAILNLEEGDAVTDWGRLIFCVADVDPFWAYLCAKGFRPERPLDASRGRALFPYARSGWA